jgi:ferrous iron transport protein B
MSAIKREMNSAKWTWFAIGYECGFAYLVAFVINQIGGALTGNINLIGLVLAVAVCACTIWLLFRPYKEATKLTKEVRVR